MRVRISYVVDVSDEYRRKINKHNDKPGMADRESIKEWFRMFGEDGAEEYIVEPFRLGPQHRTLEEGKAAGR